MATRKEVLEQLIDQAGLASVVAACSEICDEKAEHIRTNWQEDDTARPWNKAALQLAQLACRLERLDKIQFTR